MSVSIHRNQALALSLKRFVSTFHAPGHYSARRICVTSVNYTQSGEQKLSSFVTVSIQSCGRVGTPQSPASVDTRMNLSGNKGEEQRQKE